MQIRCLRRLALAAVLILVFSVLAAAPSRAQRGDSRFGEAVDVNVVTVDVYVTDRDGNPVTGLTADDFVIEEDGRKVRVEYFNAIDRRPAAAGAAATPEAGQEGSAAAASQAPTDPLHLIVMVDNTNIEIPNRNRVLQRLQGFLEDQDRQDLRVMFVDFNGSVNLIQGFTSDQQEIQQAMTALANQPTATLSRALERQGYMASIDSIFRLLAEGSNSRGEEMARIEADSMIFQVPMYAESAYRDVVEATNAMTSFVHAMAGLPGRKALIYVSDGLPLHPGEDLVTAMQSAFRDAGAFGARRPRDNADSAGGGFGRGGEDTGSGAPQESSLGGITDDRLRDIGRLQGEIAGYSTVPHFQQLTAVANANRVTFYPINADAGAGAVLGADDGGGAAFHMQSTAGFLAADQSNMRESLRFLADATGGVALASGTDIEGLLGKVQRDFDAYYSLGYSAKPAQEEEGEYREIEVELEQRRRGVELRYREGYVARPVNREPMQDALLSALLLGSGGNRHGLELEIASSEPVPEAEGQFLVTLLLRIPIDSLELAPAEGQHVAELQLSVVTQTPEGQLTPVRSMPMAIRIPSAQLEAARGQFYGAQLPMRLLAGEQRVAVGISQGDTTGGSVVSLPLSIGPAS